MHSNTLKGEKALSAVFVQAFALIKAFDCILFSKFLTQLILADVHELLGGHELGVGAPLDVAIGLARPSKGLKRRIVDELGVLNHLHKHK